MNEQSKPSDSGKRNVLGIVITILIVFAIVFLLPKILNGDLFDKKSIDAAEKYVNQQVYTSLGISCDHYESEVIFKDGDIKLIAVQFYLPDATLPSGSYCVYCKNGYVISSTKMMGAEYPYKDNLPDLRALFGI